MKKLLFMVILQLFALHAGAQLAGQDVIPAETHKIGITLSGGAALGYAHLGFLQAMDEAGVKPDCIAGTSMGAIMGMMYAAGYKPQEIKEIVKKEHFDRLWGLVSLNFPRRGGMIPMTRIRRVLLKYVPHDCFDSLDVRFYCCTFDVNRLQPIYMGRGDSLVKYVCASAAIPALFSPIKIYGNYCVDGGVCDNLPVRPLLDEGCDVRIGANLLLEKPNRHMLAETIGLHAISYCVFATSQSSLEQLTDVVTIDPGEYWMTDFSKVDELYEIGYQAGKRFFSGKKQE
ncbi:MAG: patatin-like phospholipase family protein [Bacteroidales bacterium]|nr:patatin-like phospholipase family protein [Bacteroidales bacterium]